MGSSTRRAAKFTDIELKLISLLPKDGSKISTADIVKAFYADRDPAPVNARQNIVGRLRCIADKAKRVDEIKWVLLRTPRAGPKGMSFWLERKA
jgi:hypothetical protein